MRLALFEAGFVTIIARFGLMMAIVIIGTFAHQSWFMFFAMPVFLAALLGIRFSRH